MLMSSTAAVAFVLSYPLIRGCNWARIVLVAVLSCCAVGVILLIPFSFIANHWIYTRVAISLSGLSTLCVIFFTILLLFHADVRRDFSRRTRRDRKPSNQSLQR
jgi:uncharacterized membrane protein